MAIKVAVFNNKDKGGVGKTTLSIILTQIALMNNKKVLAFDQDEQQNFNSSMFYLKEEPRFKNLFTLRTLLKKEDFDIHADLLIIDCPPGFNQRTNLALKNADFVLIPVRPDKYSLMHINNKIIRIAGEHKKLFQFPLVKIGFMEGNIHDKTLAARETSKEIADMGYTVIVIIRENERK
ncbi:MAG: ParA family protein [Synergistaceae bacterium]|nr:ParA family protein [Synergistaceae bacterium]